VCAQLDEHKGHVVEFVKEGKFYCDDGAANCEGMKAPGERKGVKAATAATTAVTPGQVAPAPAAVSSSTAVTKAKRNRDDPAQKLIAKLKADGKNYTDTDFQGKAALGDKFVNMKWQWKRAAEFMPKPGM
jgi:hypothetical protein